MSKRRKSRVYLLVTLCVMAYLTYLMIGQERIIRDKSSQITSVNQKIEDEKSKNTELNKQKEQVNSPEYIEKIARDQLGMVKPDEKVFVDINK